jgi:hypothetical protein
MLLRFCRQEKVLTPRLQPRFLYQDTEAASLRYQTKHKSTRRSATYSRPVESAMSPIAVEDPVGSPVPSLKAQSHHDGAVKPPSIARFDANDPATTTDLLVSVIERDGGVIVENIISKELAGQIKTELRPFFDTDRVDPSGFFPHTTQRATGLLGRSDACVELAMNKTYIDVANKMLSSTFTYWDGQEQSTVTSKPIISSTVGFRVNPGGRQQALHRDDR